MTWIAAIFGIAGAALIAFAPEMGGREKERAAVLLANLAWLLANLLWIIHGLITGQWALALQFSVFLYLAAIGVRNWLKP